MGGEYEILHAPSPTTHAGESSILHLQRGGTIPGAQVGDNIGLKRGWEVTLTREPARSGEPSRSGSTHLAERGRKVQNGTYPQRHRQP